VIGWLALLISLVKFARWLKTMRRLSETARVRLEQLYDIRQVELAFSP